MVVVKIAGKPSIPPGPGGLMTRSQTGPRCTSFPREEPEVPSHCAGSARAVVRAAFTPWGPTLTPGKNAVAAEGSQWQRPELAQEHSGGGQRWGKQRQRSMSHAAATP